MHLLVSFRSRRSAGLPPLSLLEATTGALHPLHLPGEFAAYHRVRGLAACRRFLYVVATTAGSAAENGSSSVESLLVINRDDLSLHSRYVFELARDVYSLWRSGGALFAVSTGTDELVELTLNDGRVIGEQVCWRPVPDAPRADRHHLSGVGEFHGELVVCGHGRPSGPESEPVRDGFIVNVTTGKRLAEDLDQPHSPIDADGALLFCESHKGVVRAVSGSRSRQLPGYPRSLCAVGPELFVATSRHLGTASAPCAIYRLALDTLQIEHTIDLGPHADAVSDLLAIDGAEAWPIFAERNRREWEAERVAMALEQSNAAWERSSRELAAADGEVQHLQARLEEAALAATQAAEHLADIEKTNQMRHSLLQDLGEEVRRQTDEIRRQEAETRQLLAALEDFSDTGREVAELQHALAEQSRLLRTTIALGAEHVTQLRRLSGLCRSREPQQADAGGETLRSLTVGVREQLLRRDEEIHAAIADIQPALAAFVQASRHRWAAPGDLSPTWEFPPVIAGPASTGHHEIAGPRTVEGWVWDPAQPDTPLRVDIYLDDLMLASVLADRFRPDLLQAGKGNGGHGFVYPLPAHLLGTAPQQIRVTISGTGVPLRDTPRRLARPAGAP
jgi:hypothetical protein